MKDHLFIVGLVPGHGFIMKNIRTKLSVSIVLKLTRSKG